MACELWWCLPERRFLLRCLNRHGEFHCWYSTNWPNGELQKLTNDRGIPYPIPTRSGKFNRTKFPDDYVCLTPDLQTMLGNLDIKPEV